MNGRKVLSSVVTVTTIKSFVITSDNSMDLLPNEIVNWTGSISSLSDFSISISHCDNCHPFPDFCALISCQMQMLRCFRECLW